MAQAGALSGKPLLTCSLPMSKDDTHLVIGHTTSGAEGLAAKAPRAHLVSAFSTVPSEVLFPVFERREKGSAPDLVYCGDDEGAKRTAARLIRDVGFNPVDLGRFRRPATLNRFRCWLRNVPTTLQTVRP